MASILDQYEQASARAGIRQPSQTLPQPINTGFINARLEDDTPIFNKQRINFNPSDQIIRLVSCNNFLVMAMSSNILQRINLEHPDQIDEIEITKAVNDQISQIFLDPTGRHLIISMTSSENYYLARNSKKPRPLGKLKGHQITVIGWNKEGSNENSTGEILLGTSRGLIVETEIVSSEDGRFFQASLEQYVKQLYNLGVDHPTPVTGLEFQKMESTSLTEYRYFVMATTPGRLYQFLGTIPTSAEAPIFQYIFSKYEHRQEQFLELPGEFGYSQLRFHHLGLKDVPRTFGWMTGPGIYFGNIDVTGLAGDNNVTVDTKLIEYPADDNNKQSHPLGMVLTEFHVLLVFPDRLQAVCVLNDQLVLEDTFASDRFGKFLGMWRDPEKGTIWTYTSQAVFKYKVIREARDVWLMYLDSENFKKAKKFCKDNPANLDKVLTREAEYFFKKGEYKKSAEIYAQTHNSFEEIALKFIQLDNKDALKGFLLKKMSALKPQDRTQLTMIVTWVIEIYLNQLGLLKEQENETSKDFNNLQEEFRNFLSQSKVKDCVNHNRGTIYDLIASHGDLEDMIFFAVLMQDYERVITHHIQHESYKNALDVLAKQSDVELFYKFSPLLMQNIPKDTVDAWMSKGRQLDSKQLIPALVQYDHMKNRAQGNEAIRYLEYCVQVLDNRDLAIHNYLISLYAQLQPDRLMKYLHMQGQDPETVCYDLKYALRLCAEHGHNKACIHIYSTMGLYEEAVDLALQVDVDLAKQNAERPEDEELMKKLWLKIACHVVEEEKDIKRAMEMVHECNLLKIEDILPFFPDFVTIDHFKDAICTSLQEYNQHIESLKEDMEEATESAKDIRGEIQAFRNKYSFVKGMDKCSSCSFPLMTRAFYVFPCMHKFHSDCLIAEVIPHLVASKRIKVEELQRKLASRDSSSSSRNVQGIPATTGLDSNIKDELDDLVAGECIYCGDIMIRSIDRPFVEENEFDGVAKSWL